MAQKRSGSADLIERLNTAVATLIGDNRKLRRDIVKLTERAAATATKTAKRGARAISRRVKKVVMPKKKTTAKATTKRKVALARTPKRKPSSSGTRRTRR